MTRAVAGGRAIETVFLDAGGVLVHPNWTRVTVRPQRAARGEAYWPSASSVPDAGAGAVTATAGGALTASVIGAESRVPQ